MASILIVEDDIAIARLVADHLQRAGHVVDVVHDGGAALLRARASRPTLMLLDVMLPGASGIEVCAEVRTWGPPQPVIVMLTARSSEDDAVEAFESGADDYVRKPFGVAELVRRVEALLGLSRRAPVSVSVMRLGAMEIDRAARQVTVGGASVRLTPKELDLLVHLAERPGNVLDRDSLLAEVWGYSHAGYARTVDSHVTRIRKKLAAAGLSPEPIATVHGVGYRFDARVDAKGTDA